MNVKQYTMQARNCAEYIGLSETAVSRFCRIGKLKSVQNTYKGNWYINVDDFVDFLYKNPKYAAHYFQRNAVGFNLLLREYIAGELAKRPPLYSGKDLEKLFDVTSQSIHNWVRAGYLTPIGTTTYRSYLFSEENVVSAVQKNLNLYCKLRNRRLETCADPRINDLRNLCLKEWHHEKGIPKNYA